jgi:hypothetical protein
LKRGIWAKEVQSRRRKVERALDGRGGRILDGKKVRGGKRGLGGRGKREMFPVGRKNNVWALQASCVPTLALVCGTTCGPWTPPPPPFALVFGTTCGPWTNSPWQLVLFFKDMTKSFLEFNTAMFISQNFVSPTRVTCTLWLQRSPEQIYR